MSAWWPVVQNRLVSLFPTLPGFTDVTVYDGPTPGDLTAKEYVAVGHAITGDGAGSYSQPDSAVTGLRDEVGDVLCTFSVWSGNTDIATVRAQAFALVDSLDTAVRADQRLGVLPPSSTVTLSVEVLPQQLPTGAEQSLLVTVHYTALS